MTPTDREIARKVALRIGAQMAQGVRHVLIAGAELDVVLFALERVRAPDKDDE